MRLPFKDDTGLLPHSPRLLPVVCYMLPMNYGNGSLRLSWAIMTDETMILQLLTCIKSYSVLATTGRIKSELDITPLQSQRTQA